MPGSAVGWPGMIGMACTECGKYPVMNRGWLENPHIYMIFPLKPTCTWCTPDFLGSHVWLPEANRFWFQIAEFPDVPPLPLEPPPVADSCELEEVDVGCSLPCRCGWPAVDPLLEHILIRAKGPAVPDASWVCFPATFEIWGSTRDTWRMLYSSTFSHRYPWQIHANPTVQRLYKRSWNVNLFPAPERVRERERSWKAGKIVTSCYCFCCSLV